MDVSRFGRRHLLGLGLGASVVALAGDASAAGAKPAGEAVPTRPLGRTGAQVSMVGLGGFHIGSQKDPAESIALVRNAIDRGVTFMDNCWDYNGGESEERMGQALTGGYRQRAFLMTKIDGRTREPARAQLEQSLRRLRTDAIDLVQVHEIIRAGEPEECFREGGCMEALIEAKRAGKLRFIGFTGHKDPDIHLAMLRAADAHGFRFDAVQMPLNVMDAHYRSFEKKVLPVLVDRGIGVLGMKSLGAGAILEAKVVTPVECLHYAMNLPTSVVITGCDDMKILDQAIHAATTYRPMGPDAVRALLARTKEKASRGAYEAFKTTGHFDGTARNPHWLTSAKI